MERDATFGALFASPNARMATAERLVRRMDEDGVEVSVVMGIGWTHIDLARAVNDYLIEAVKKYPDRLVGLAGVNPAWGAEALREVRRCVEAGLRGIGELHPDTQGYDLGDLDTMAPLMEFVREHGLIVTTHSSEPVGHRIRGREGRGLRCSGVHPKIPGRTSVRSLGRRPAVLRSHVRGRGRTGTRLLRHRGDWAGTSCTMRRYSIR